MNYPDKPKASPWIFKRLYARILYALFMFMLVVYLVFSSKVVIKATNVGQNVEGLQALPAALSEEDESIAYFFDRDEATKNLTLDHLITGWALIDTRGRSAPANAAEEMRQVDLIFFSDAASYRVPTTLETRRDINRLHPDQKAGAGRDYGFSCEFSSLPFKNGNYTLFLYIYEDSQNTAMISTERHYVMDGNGLHRVDSEIQSEAES